MLLSMIIFAVTFPQTVSLKVALIPKIKSNFFDSAYAGCLRQAYEETKNRKRKITCDFLFPSSRYEDEHSTQQQIEILERIIANKTHQGVAISVNDDEKLTPVVNKVVKNGIPVITFDSDASMSLRSTFVGSNNTALGDQMAKILLQINPKGGVFGIVTTFPAENLAKRVEGIRKRLENTKWKESGASPKGARGNVVESLRVMREMMFEDTMINAILPIAYWPMGNASAWKDFVNDYEMRNTTYIVGDSTQKQFQLLSEGFGDGLIGQVPYEMGEKAMGKWCFERTVVFLPTVVVVVVFSIF